MAVYSFPAVAITDSTATGRSLIKAADEAAARAGVGLSATDDVTFNSVSAVDGDFSGKVKTEYVYGTDDTTSASVWLRDATPFGYLASDSAGGSALRWGGNDLLSFKNIIPQFFSSDEIMPDGKSIMVSMAHSVATSTSKQPQELQTV